MSAIFIKVTCTDCGAKMDNMKADASQNNEWELKVFPCRKCVTNEAMQLISSYAREQKEEEE